MKTHVFLITAKTRIHVGDEGGAEFTIIDKAIQRDPLTHLPCINSSSLKGSISEFCTSIDGMDRLTIFGSDKADNAKSSKKGKAVFFDAKLLYLPQQDDINLFHHVTSESIISSMEERVRLFCKDFKYEQPPLPRNVVLVNDEKMLAICDDDNLPIIARNVLDDGGISKNLWYEQVLPSETIFYTIILEEGDVLKKALHNSIVQIGANASIGYGYCKFECIFSK